MTFVLGFIIVLVSATFMHHAEGRHQPESFGSIPHAMWWAVVTLTTVGYGDVYPVTAFGRLLAGIIAFVGIGMFALPAGILGAGLVEDAKERAQAAHDESEQGSPHRGKKPSAHLLLVAPPLSVRGRGGSGIDRRGV